MRAVETVFNSVCGAVLVTIGGILWKGLREPASRATGVPEIACTAEQAELGQVKAHLQVVLVLTFTLALTCSLSCCCACICGVLLYRTKTSERTNTDIVDTPTSTVGGRVISGQEGNEAVQRIQRPSRSARGIPQKGDRGILASLAASEVRKQ
eukprot:2191010-Amphidinium_carterae.2